MKNCRHCSGTNGKVHNLPCVHCMSPSMRRAAQNKLYPGKALGLDLGWFRILSGQPGLIKNAGALAKTGEQKAVLARDCRRILRTLAPINGNHEQRVAVRMSAIVQKAVFSAFNEGLKDRSIQGRITSAEVFHGPPDRYGHDDNNNNNNNYDPDNDYDEPDSGLSVVVWYSSTPDRESPFLVIYEVAIEDSEFYLCNRRHATRGESLREGSHSDSRADCDKCMALDSEDSALRVFENTVLKKQVSSRESREYTDRVALLDIHSKLTNNCSCTKCKARKP